MSGLIPCPFCKRADLLAVERHPENGSLGIHCWSCGCIGPSKESETVEEAIAHWNNRVSDWKPIETAPKDGTRILAWSKEWTGSHTAQFYSGYGKWGCFNMYFDIQPTHYMENPEPEEDPFSKNTY